jgi:predicted Zn-dependent protease with MMP-like domain
MVKISPQEFEKILLDAYKSLPAIFREKIENVALVVEEWSGYQEKKTVGAGGDVTLLGLYRGVPRKHRDSNYANVLPDKIIIYKGPLLALAKNKPELKALVKEVLFHEVGHYFGLSEEELREIEE